MLIPLRCFGACPLSDDSSEDDISVRSPYSFGFFLSRALRRVDAPVLSDLGLI